MKANRIMICFTFLFILVVANKSNTEELIRNFKPVVLDSTISKSEFKFSLSPKWNKIRIKFDTSEMIKFLIHNFKYKAKLKNAMYHLLSVQKYVQNFFSIEKYFEHFYIKKNLICLNIPLTEGKYKTDLYIKIIPIVEDKGSFAAATPCNLSKFNKRPITGLYFLNLKYYKLNQFTKHSYFSVFLHEFTHILGFNKVLFNYFQKGGETMPLSEVTSRMNISNSEFVMIKLPHVVNYARSYFNCPTIQGIPLENNGGPGSKGSHWEKVFLPNEYMNPTRENQGIISEFTLSLLRGTGWYKIEKESGQYYDWGKEDGCNHFKICPTGREYCGNENIGKVFCTPDYMGSGYCGGRKPFSECAAIYALEFNVCSIGYINKRFELNDEVLGPGSRCIMSSVIGRNKDIPRCYKTECVDKKLIITVGDGSNYECTSTAQVITIKSGSKLTCPDISDFCNELEQKCPNDCGGNHGICLDSKECFCFYGWGGTGCESVTAKGLIILPIMMIILNLFL